MNRASRRVPLSTTISLLVLVIICVLPLVWTSLAAFGLYPDASTKPPSWQGTLTLEKFLDIGLTEPNFIREISNSLLLSLSTMILSVVIALGAAYSLARSNFASKNLVTHGIFVLACLPTISYVIPLQGVLHQLHLYDQISGLILAQTALYTPLAVYILHGYLRSLPLDLEEAAYLDGADLWQVLRRVVVPSLNSSLAATALIVFVLSWNQLLMPLVLSARTKTIPVAMIDFFTYEREMEWPIAAAALITSLLPIVLVVAFAHRPLEQFRLNADAND